MILILNNKANLNFKEIKIYEKKLRKYNVIILPTSCYLPIFKKGKYILGAQDVSEYEKTDRTGEINAKQLEQLNVKYCLIGHSERKIYKNETNEVIINKIHRCLENNIIPIYCIGELKNNENKDELKEQLNLILNITKNNQIIIAYEPINNIGNPEPSLEKIESCANFIKKYIKDNYNTNCKLVYGGGVSLKNIKKLKEIKNLDGFIIATESLNIETVKKIYKENWKQLKKTS